MASSDNLLPIVKSEHIGDSSTGDNINAKRVAGYGWDGSAWQRNPLPFFSAPYDTVILTYTDSSKTTLATAVSYLNSAVQQTITLTQGTLTDTYVRS